MTAKPTRDLELMAMAARLALRGHGGAEPNPLVGSVIVSPAGQVVGWGYHARCGGPHAEIVALKRADEHARGATVHVTLEPCSHTGRTGPCTDAISGAGVKRVVIARRDPNPVAAGGLERLRKAGITVDLLPECEPAVRLADPFVHRVRTGLPWIIAKWAQTLDGRIATRSGASKWISNERSRRLVHRERGRVDAILTGIGTVLADDPLLTARGVHVRRIARRIVIDPKFDIPMSARLIATAGEVPTTIICGQHARTAAEAKAAALARAGVEIIGIPIEGEPAPLAPVLRDLTARHDLTNVLVEAGPGLLSRLFEQKLVKEAWIFTAPMLLGDGEAPSSVRRAEARQLTDGLAMRLISLHRRGDDVVARYGVG